MNKFTLENTKDATHVYLIERGRGVQFANKYGYINDSRDCMNGRDDSKLIWSYGSYDTSDYDIDLTDQTGRGYPTLEWFLKCGNKLVVGDWCIDTCGSSKKMLSDLIAESWNTTIGSGDIFVESTNYNRCDLTQMARDEYYANKDKADSDEQDELGAHASYLWDLSQKVGSSCEANNKPVYTQAMADAGELPPVGSTAILFVSEYAKISDDVSARSGEVFDVVAHHRGLAVAVSMDCYTSIAANEQWFKPIDTRTDEEKLRDAINEIWNESADKWQTISNMLSADKLTITLKE